jgi:hypothetical protein
MEKKEMSESLWKLIHKAQEAEHAKHHKIRWEMYEKEELMIAQPVIHQQKMAEIDAIVRRLVKINDLFEKVIAFERQIQTELEQIQKMDG